MRIKKSQQDKKFFVIAHNIRSLQNVGSIFRTSDAFAVSKLFLTGYTGKPPESKITKTALGAEEVVPWEYNKSISRVIKKIKLDFPKATVIGLENNIREKTVNMANFKPKFPLVLVLGTETTGIPANAKKICQGFVEIPMKGKKESLNVSVAFGIAAYEIHKNM